MHSVAVTKSGLFAMLRMLLLDVIFAIELPIPHILHRVLRIARRRGNCEGSTVSCDGAVQILSGDGPESIVIEGGANGLAFGVFC